MAVHNSKAKTKVLNCGRRWGKGVAAAFECISVVDLLSQLERPAIMVPRYRMWIIGPSYPQLDQAWEEVAHHLPPEFETRPPLIDEKTRYLVNDGRLQFKSADNPNSLQNVALDWVWITEAQDIPDSVWDYKISPMLESPGVLGWAFIEGHAPYPDTWYERLFRLGQQGNPEIESWLFPTNDNPYIDWEAILLKAEDMPEEAFRQEYLCETPSALGRAFSEDAIQQCISGDFEEPREGASYVLGVDLGKQIDPTVIFVMRKSQRRIVGFDRLLKTDWTVQEDIISDMSEKWNRATVYMDATGLGEPVCEHLKKRGVPVRGLNLTKQKNEIVNKLAAGMEHETVKYPNIPVLIRELRQCKRVQKDKQGRVLKQEWIGAPTGYHDDCVIALALALHGSRYSGEYEPIKTRHLEMAA